MDVKLILYILVLPFTFWAVESLRIEHLFKKGRSSQIIVTYVLLTIGLTYLAVNFIYDFYEVSRILY